MKYFLSLFGQSLLITYFFVFEAMGVITLVSLWVRGSVAVMGLFIACFFIALGLFIIKTYD